MADRIESEVVTTDLTKVANVTNQDLFRHELLVWHVREIVRRAYEAGRDSADAQ